MKIRAAVIGGSGYTGAEIVRILSGHPQIAGMVVTSEQNADKPISAVSPNLKGVTDQLFQKLDVSKIAEESDVVFTALPHGRPMKIVPELLEKGCKVIDISGDYRLKSEDDYKKWYGMEHSSSGLLKKSVYGLTELNADKIKKTDLVANPGCYPTGVILGLAPAVTKDLVFEQDIVVDSMSGVSGAGKTPTESLHFCSCYDNVTSYKVGGMHQHIPEMEQILGGLAKEEVTVSFTPHLLPVSRGIYSTSYADLKKDITHKEAVDIYKEFYKASYFVQVLDEGEYPQLKSVLGSNFCHIGVSVDARCGRLIVVSAIDNLIKGAAGQAVQNMNVMNGLDEKSGLESPGVYP